MINKKNKLKQNKLTQNKLTQNKLTKNKLTKNKLTQNKSYSLKGGRFLGKGAYGCVITPAISCNRNETGQTDINLKSKVSKIIVEPDADLEEEITISKEIKAIDQNGKYFITFDDSCPLRQIPSDRTNIVASRYYKYGNETGHMILNRRKKVDDKYCPIDLSKKPINIIMPYGGIDVYSLIDDTPKTNMQKILKTTIIKNFRNCFKNLVEGLYILHSNNIVVRDIKEENLIANLLYDINQQPVNNRKRTKKQNKQNKQYTASLKYIDFGISSILTKSFTSSKENIARVGSDTFIPPEIFICNSINYFLTNEQNPDHKYILKDLYKFLYKNTYELLTFFQEYDLAKDFYQNISTMYYNILKEFDNDEVILDRFFGRGNMKYDGYIQKADIYALGISMYEFLFLSGQYNIKNNMLLHDLLINMINIDPNKRYNIIQCLKHPYFTK